MAEELESLSNRMYAPSYFAMCLALAACHVSCQEAVQAAEDSLTQPGVVVVQGAAVEVVETLYVTVE